MSEQAKRFLKKPGRCFALRLSMCRIPAVLFSILLLVFSMFMSAVGLTDQPPLVTDCPPESPVPESLSAEQADVPILMYHKITRHGPSLGQLAITPNQFEEDLLFIEQEGYHTVTMTELIDFVHNGAPLPEKPIVLTFDDGDHSVYRYVYPLLKEYDMKAVVSVIGGITDAYTNEGRTDITYPHMIWPQIREMSDSGLVEIQNHSYDLHGRKNGAQGILRRPGEAPDAYCRRLTEDVTHTQTRILEMTGRPANTFTYPFGAFDKEAAGILREDGFQATLICCKGVNRLTRGDPDCLFGLRRNIRPHNQSTSKVFSAFNPG